MVVSVVSVLVFIRTYNTVSKPCNVLLLIFLSVLKYLYPCTYFNFLQVNTCTIKGYTNTARSYHPPVSYTRRVLVQRGRNP